ncbi:MAG: tetratricopeptide repeat protein [Acidobacteriaceae bacterium]
MSLHIMIGLIGLLYIIIFGGMALIRREGLSVRFAVEAVCLTALAVILVVLTPIQIHPTLFLLLLYVLTLRVRLIVDLANFFARRGRNSQAERIYDFAYHVWPDQTSKLIIMVNQATLHLQENKLDQSIALFKDVLDQKNRSALGIKYEAAAHFNLGVAYMRNNHNSLASIEFNETIDTWPASLYAHRAQNALERLRHKDVALQDDAPTNN